MDHSKMCDVDYKDDNNNDNENQNVRHDEYNDDKQSEFIDNCENQNKDLQVKTH